MFFLYHILNFMIINLYIYAFVCLSLKKNRQNNNPFLTCIPPSTSVLPFRANFPEKEVHSWYHYFPFSQFSIYPSLTSSTPFWEMVLVIVTRTSWLPTPFSLYLPWAWIRIWDCWACSSSWHSFLLATRICPYAFPPTSWAALSVSFVTSSLLS